jgi:hypothetical protein
VGGCEITIKCFLRFKVQFGSWRTTGCAWHASIRGILSAAREEAVPDSILDTVSFEFAFGADSVIAVVTVELLPAIGFVATSSE